MTIISGAHATEATLERLRQSIEASNKVMEGLTTRIWWLNLALLVFTVAIFGLTTVQAFAAWRSLVH